MKLLIIMQAVPGAGKSTWIRKNYPGNAAVVCSADDHFYELGCGTYAFDPTQLGVAHKKCQEKAVEAMARGAPTVIIDNTNLHAEHMAPYVKVAKAHGYYVRIVRIKPTSFAEAYTRNTHGVPKHAHDRMVEAYKKGDIPTGVELVIYYGDAWQTVSTPRAM